MNGRGDNMYCLNHLLSFARLLFFSVDLLIYGYQTSEQNKRWFDASYGTILFPSRFLFPRSLSPTHPSMIPRQRRAWTAEEDQLLFEAVNQGSQHTLPITNNGSLIFIEEDSETLKPSDWCSISKNIPNRTNKDCRKRWMNRFTSAGALQKTTKGAWTEEEDEQLRAGVEAYGPRCIFLLHTYIYILVNDPKLICISFLGGVKLRIWYLEEIVTVSLSVLSLVYGRFGLRI